MIALLIFWPRSSEASFETCHLSGAQRSYLQFSYVYGAPYGFGYTLAAIAMRESMLGLYKINLQDPSAGLYHVTTDKVIRHFNWVDTPFNHNRAAQLMMEDPVLSAYLAVQELKLWQRVHGKGNWRKIWASYNGGTRGNAAYGDIIAQNIQTIKDCGWLRHNYE